jgi:GntR family transcriptional regulator
MKRKETSGSTQPRYQFIADQLLREIATGVLPVGNLMPSEAELRAKFKVSRGTLRRSMTVLADAGLIVRRQRSGTRVLAKFPARGLVDRDQIIEDWGRYGTNYPLRIASIVPEMPPREFLKNEKRLPRGPWLAVTGLRYPPSSRVPVSYCQAFIRPEYSDIADQLSSSPIPIFALIEQRYGRVIEGIRVQLRSVVLSPHVAQELGAAAGGPALQLIRLFTDGKGRTVEIAVNTHPADRYTYRMEIVRAGATTVR